MTAGAAATRLMLYLTEDDRVDSRSLADVVIERARDAGLVGATLWRGLEGFGASGRLRAARLPDLARGLPLVVEIIDAPEVVAGFLPVLRELAAGALLTLEPVTMERGTEPVVAPVG